MEGWQIGLYVLSALLTTTCALLVSRRAPQPGVMSFSYLLLSETVWSLGYIGELVSDGLKDKVLWDNVQFLTWVAMLVFMVRFVWDYTEHPPTHARLVMALYMVVPTLATAWVFTDPLHGLARGSAYIAPAPPFGALLYDFTVPEQLLLAQTYGTIAYVVVSLRSFLAQQHATYRRQVWLVIFGLVLPTLARISSSISTLSFSARMAMHAPCRLPLRLSLALTSSATTGKTSCDQP